jgi:hypothetical protein
MLSQSLRFGFCAGLIWGCIALVLGEDFYLHLFHLICQSLMCGALVGVLVSLVLSMPLRWMSNKLTPSRPLRFSHRLAAALLGIAILPFATSIFLLLTLTLEFLAWHEWGWGRPIQWRWDPWLIIRGGFIGVLFIWWLIPLAAGTTVLLQSRLHRVARVTT